MVTDMDERTADLDRDTSQDTPSHQPDLPFGCMESWGAYVAPPGRGLLSDMQVHTCNVNGREHAGPHVCKCGDTQAQGQDPPPPPKPWSDPEAQDTLILGSILRRYLEDPDGGLSIDQDEGNVVIDFFTFLSPSEMAAVLRVVPPRARR